MKHTWLSKNLISFGCASFFNDFCHEMSTALLPALVNQLVGFSLAPAALGIIEGVSDAASTIMKLFSGWLADRVSYYKPFLILGYGLTPFCIALIGTAHSVWSILIYRTIAWISRGIREPMRDTWISKIVSSGYYGRAFGFQRAMDTLGAIAGPLTALIFLAIVPFRIIFFVAFIPGILSVLAILCTTEKKEQHRTKHSSSFIQDCKTLSGSYRYFVGVMLLFGLGNFHHILLINRVQEIFGTTDSPIMATGWTIILYTIFNSARALAEFGIGSLSDFVNRKNLLALFGFGLFGLISICFMSNTQHVWLWFIFFIGAGISAGTVKTLEKAYAAQLLPESIRGTGLGILQTIDGIGDLLSSTLVGILWSLFSPIIALSYAAGISFIAMFLLLLKKK